MDRFDLSRQDISSLAQVSDDIVRQVERGGDDEYALSFAQNRIIEVQDISRFQHVIQLDMSSNKIVSLDGIQALQRLESVNVSRNNLLSVDVLAKLPVLRVLNVSENSIVQLDALKEHRELMVLDASFNNITRWPLFGAMNALESLDVSSNLLEAFSPTSVPLLFPENLCRLSIAKNQIHEVCGIGSLGMHLPKLQSLNVEGNPAMTQLQRSGGRLEYLLTNFFPSLAPNVEECSDPLARSRSEAFVVPRATLATMQQVLQQGKEEMLVEFLRTGAVPQQSELPIPMARKAIVESTIEPNRFKVEELVPPAPPQPAIVSTAAHAATADGNDSNPALAVSSTALSKESKMEMWKRIQEERKAQQGREKGRLQREMLAEQSSSQGRHDLDQIAPPTSLGLQVSARAERSDERVARPEFLSHPESLQLPPPPPPLVLPPSSKLSAPPPLAPLPAAPIATSLKVSAPHLSQISKDVGPAKKPQVNSVADDRRGEPSPCLSGVESQNLAGQVKALQEQVLTMRKYMKVWIKREQMLREAAATRLQRWFRRVRARQVVTQQCRRRKQEWQKKYAFRHCSSCPLVPDAHSNAAELIVWHRHAQMLQRTVRGRLTRVHLKEWRELHYAATRIQRSWKNFVQNRDEILGFSLLALSRHRCSNTSPASVGQLATRVVNAVAHFGADVKQLQQVCVAQEQGMIQLWGSTARFQRYLEYRIEVAVIRTQSLWRGYRVRKTTWRRGRIVAYKEPIRRPERPENIKKTVDQMQTTIEQQSREISKLSEQVRALQTMVERLLSKKSVQ